MAATAAGVVFQGRDGQLLQKSLKINRLLPFEPPQERT
jgi:hypothetical protein